MMNYSITFNTPVGPLCMESDGEALTRLNMEPGPDEGESCPVLEQARAWLEDYFCGNHRPIDFPMNPKGTPFQKLIWEILLTIPYGKTRTYGSIAREAAEKLGRCTMSAQAVGGAVGRNPIAIIIPCHRVIGTNGSLTGFAWGVDKKEWLLRHEGTL